MQQAVAIDTMSYTRNLTDSGVKRENAEKQSIALNGVLLEFQDKNLKQLATKGDLKATKADLQAEISALRTEFTREISRLEVQIAKVDGKVDKVRSDLMAMISKTESTLIKWGVSLIIAQFAAFVAVTKFF